MINAFSKVKDFFWFLYIQRIRGFPPPGNEPFMPVDELNRFKQEIFNAATYVEFGSGGSTVFASKHCASCISVENDRFYARAVASQLEEGAVKQVIASLGFSRQWGVPLFPNARKAAAYVAAPWGSEPFPDFILVDGRYRIACALEAARRAHEARASAVLMFDDYGDRPHFHIVEEVLGEPEMAGRAAIFRIGKQHVPRASVEKWLEDPA